MKLRGKIAGACVVLVVIMDGAAMVGLGFASRAIFGGDDVPFFGHMVIGTLLTGTIGLALAALGGLIWNLLVDLYCWFHDRVQEPKD